MHTAPLPIRYGSGRYFKETAQSRPVHRTLPLAMSAHRTDILMSARPVVPPVTNALSNLGASDHWSFLRRVSLNNTLKGRICVLFLLARVVAGKLARPLLDDGRRRTANRLYRNVAGHLEPPRFHDAYLRPLLGH